MPDGLILTEQEQILAAHIVDLYSICQKRNIPKYSFFMNEREGHIAGLALKNARASDYSFYGGYEGAKRTVVGFFPDYMAGDMPFPIVPVTFTFRKQDKLSHRDFLGALMALKIERDCIGDILVGDGLAVIFAYETVAALILDQVSKVSSVGVTARQGMHALPLEARFEEITGTIASPRLDAIISLCTKASRERAASLIESGAVALNHVMCKNGAKHVAEQDTFTVSGYGKYIVAQFGHQTKKGRLYVSISKYL